MTPGGEAGGGGVQGRKRAVGPAVRVALVAAFLLLGPATFVVSRARALGLAYAHVQPGDTAASVVATMGRPQQQAGADSPGTAMQYVYRAWPWPHQWVVNLRDGKVTGKSEISR